MQALQAATDEVFGHGAGFLERLALRGDAVEGWHFHDVATFFGGLELDRVPISCTAHSFGASGFGCLRLPQT